MALAGFHVNSYLWVVLCVSDPNFFHSSLICVTQRYILLNHYTHICKVCVRQSLGCTGTVDYLKVLVFLLKKLGLISSWKYVV
jgi:hypothetical protein